MPFASAFTSEGRDRDASQLQVKFWGTLVNEVAEALLSDDQNLGMAHLRKLRPQARSLFSGPIQSPEA
jgi:hypothetical protein